MGQVPDEPNPVTADVIATTAASVAAGTCGSLREFSRADVQKILTSAARIIRANAQTAAQNQQKFNAEQARKILRQFEIGEAVLLDAMLENRMVQALLNALQKGLDHTSTSIPGM